MSLMAILMPAKGCSVDCGRCRRERTAIPRLLRPSLATFTVVYSLLPL